MGPAAVAVAVTTLRTRARLHTVHTAAWRHCSVLATTGDNAGILHFNPQGVAPGPQLLSGNDEIHFHSRGSPMLSHRHLQVSVPKDVAGHDASIPPPGDGDSRQSGRRQDTVV